MNPALSKGEQAVARQPALSFSAPFYFPFNRAGGRTLIVRLKFTKPMKNRTTSKSLPVAATLFLSCFMPTYGATTVGFNNFTPTTSLPPESGFPLSMINDGITGTLNSLNGFVSNSLGVISFSFNQDYNLRSFILWNDVVVNAEGIDDFALRFYDSADDLISTPASTAYIGPVGQLAPAEYTFSSPVQGVRRVELDVLSVQSPFLTTRTEIREVDFGVVPEPSSTLLISMGIAGLAFSRRRNR